MRIGSGYLGSPNLETSVANAEIIPDAPTNWTSSYKLYKFSLWNSEACTIKLNDGSAIYLRAGQGFNMDQNDKELNSVVICENNIHYSWVGAF